MDTETEQSECRQTGASHPMPDYVRTALRIYLMVLIGLFAIEWGSALFHQYVLHATYPYTSVLFNRDVRYSDWTNFALRVSHYGEPGMLVRKDLGLPYPYPLPSLYIYLTFIRLFPNSLLAYKIFTCAEFFCATAAFWLYVRRQSRSLLAQIAVWLTLLLGSPALHAYDRGNIEVFLWLFVVFGLVAFVRRWHYAAAIFFALAACMKIYPALFFLLFLPRRQFKALVLGVVSTSVFSLLALQSVGPTIIGAFRDMSGSAEYLNRYQVVALANDNLRFDHSLLALEKQSLAKVLYLRSKLKHRPMHDPTFERSAKVYSILAPLGFLAIYLLRIRKLPLLNQFTALTLLCILLPYVSYEYTLMHVYLVFAVILIFLIQNGNASEFRLYRARLNLMMICFAVIIGPLAILAREHYQGQIKCLALLALLAIIVATPMPSSLFDDFRSSRP